MAPYCVSHSQHPEPSCFQCRIADLETYITAIDKRVADLDKQNDDLVAAYQKSEGLVNALRVEAEAKLAAANDRADGWQTAWIDDVRRERAETEAVSARLAGALVLWNEYVGHIPDWEPDGERFIVGMEKLLRGD